jgi:hypothetical protein
VLKKSEADDDKAVLILLAGLLLRGEPRPDVRKLERLIKVPDGTLSDLFPQRKKRYDSKPKPIKGGDSNNQ